MNQIAIKDILVIVIIYVALMCLAACAGNTDTDTQCDPIAASQALLSSFEISGNGYIFPDNYAGEWIDGLSLYLALTDVSKRGTREYKEILDGYGCIEIVKTDYSLNHLNAVKDAAATVLVSDCTVSSYYIDVKQNKIVFEVIDTDCEKAKNILTEQLKTDKPFYLDKSIEVNEDMFSVVEGDTQQNRD